LFKLQEWYRLAPFAIAALLLGCWGFLRCGQEPFALQHLSCSDTVGLPEAAARAIGLVRPNLEYLSSRYPWQLALAALLFPSLTFIGVFKVAVDSIRRDMRVVGARRKRNHVIVCGLGQTGHQIVHSFRNAGLEVVAISLDASKPEAVSCEHRGVPVLTGDAGQTAILKMAGLAHARALIVTSGSDAKNLEVGMRALDALATAGNRDITILSQVRSRWLYGAISEHRTAVLGAEGREFRFFNLDRNGAHAMLQSPAFLRAVPVSETQPNLLFAGFGEMGSEIFIQAALCAFALPGRRLFAIALDERSEKSTLSADMKYSHIRSLTDLRVLACSFEPLDPDVRKTLKAALTDDRPPHAVIVALGSDEVALNVAVQFRKILDEVAMKSVPIFVRLREKNKLGAFLAQVEGKSAGVDRLLPFGDLAELTAPRVLLDEEADLLARAAHEVFLKLPTDNLTANVPWSNLPEYFKQQNIDFANHIPVKLRALGYDPGAKNLPDTFSAEEIETLAEIEHWRWSLGLKARGWDYGAVQDNSARLHPLLVDWAEIPEDVKERNRNMVRSIPEILKRTMARSG
jgi:TrkA-N domain/RyR domain